MKTGVDGEEQRIDVMKINRPDDLIDITNLGLTLAEGKRLLAGLQQETVAAQARGLMPFGDRIAKSVARFVV